MNGGESLTYNPNLLVEQNPELVRAVLSALPSIEDQDFHWELSNTEKGQQILDMLVAQGVVDPESDVTPRRIAFIIRDKDHYIRREHQESENVGEQLELELVGEA